MHEPTPWLLPLTCVHTSVALPSTPCGRYRDLQLIVDVVMSGGVPQRKGGPPAGAPPVQLYFSNPDLLWANEFPRSRFGQGAFAHAVMVRWGGSTRQRE